MMAEAAFNLAPKGIASEYDVPASDWEIVNKRVSVVLDPTRAPAIQAKLKALSNYAQIVSVCQTWKASTFDALVTFAQDLAPIAQTDMQSYLTVLGMVIDAMVDGDKTLKTRLDNTVAGMVADTKGLAQQARALTPVLKDFDDQMNLTSVGDGQDPLWSAFTIEAGLSFNFIGGRFALIAQDLLSLQTTVAGQIKNDDPVLVKLVGLPDAKLQWGDVGNLAQGFAANAPAQKQFLQGYW